MDLCGITSNIFNLQRLGFCEAERTHNIDNNKKLELKVEELESVLASRTQELANQLEMKLGLELKVRDLEQQLVDVSEGSSEQKCDRMVNHLKRSIGALQPTIVAIKQRHLELESECSEAIEVNL